MKNYKYIFVDGTSKTVEVTDGLYKLLHELDLEEKRNERREHRRHVSLEALVECNSEPTACDEYFVCDGFVEVENERLQAGIESLLPRQQDLLYRLFCEGQSMREIAESDGVAPCSISNRLARIYKKLANFL